MRNETEISIKYEKHPTGGLGNRLFQYNFISQLAKQISTDFDFISIKDVRNFKKSITFNPKSFIKINKYEVSSEYILEKGPEVIEEIMLKHAEGFQIVLNGTFLGNYFFDFTAVDPKSLIEVKTKKNFSHQHISLHFRGGDFKAWNSRAILSRNYYLNAVAEIDKKEEKKLPICLVTDDKNLPTLKSVQENFQDRILDTGLQSKCTLDDFALLRDATYLISSPSTFAIWAGILGQQETIFHSREWVEYRCSEGDKFWIDLSKGGNSFYKASFID